MEEEQLLLDAIIACRRMVRDVENQLHGPSTDSEKQLSAEMSIKPCIYRAPQRIRKGAEEEFEPKLVSLGPYHFGKPHLATFEAHKHSSLLHCLRRAKKDLREIEEAVRNIVTELYYCYDNLSQLWKINDSPDSPDSPEDFVRLMVVDGCFLVEFINGICHRSTSDNPVFHVLNILDVMDDSMLLENQLPMRLLELLYTILHPKLNFKDVVYLGFLEHASEGFPVFYDDKKLSNLANFKHWVDYITASIEIGESWVFRREGSWKSAVEISNAGVDFEMSMERIEFKNGILCLPLIRITHQTKRKLLNGIAYEMLSGGDAVVTDYVILMANLLKTPEDVRVLCSAWIISNKLENHQAVVDLFNNISHVASGGQLANILNDKINAYCDTKWRRFRAHVKGTYFRSPWAMFSLVYAIILFLFTAGQTYYTVAAYYSSTRPK